VEIRVVEERANPLLKRHEYRFEVTHPTGPTPKREEVRGELAKVVRAPKDRVIIERMRARFGTAVTRGDANVYDTAEAAKQITRAHILVRHGLKEKPTKGAAPAATPPAAAAPPSPAPAAEPPKAAEPKKE
jgi:small subunit ribosomal protein S24e